MIHTDTPALATVHMYMSLTPVFIPATQTLQVALHLDIPLSVMAMAVKTAMDTELMLPEQLQAQHTVSQSQLVLLRCAFLIVLVLVSPHPLLQESTGSPKAIRVVLASST
jgi:hypothetical protein